MGVCPPLPPPAPGEIHTLYTFQCNTTESQSGTTKGIFRQIITMYIALEAAIQ